MTIILTLQDSANFQKNKCRNLNTKLVYDYRSIYLSNNQLLQYVFFSKILLASKMMLQQCCWKHWTEAYSVLPSKHEWLVKTINRARTHPLPRIGDND